MLSFVSRKRLKKQWALAFVSAITDWKGTEAHCSLWLCTFTSPELSSQSLDPLHPLSTSTNQNCMCDCIPVLPVPVLGPCLFYWRNMEEGLKAALLQLGHNQKNNFTLALLSLFSSNLFSQNQRTLTFNLSQALLEALPWFAHTHCFLEKQEISLCYFNPGAFIEICAIIFNNFAEGKICLQAPKIVSPVQNINLKHSDGNLILPHRDCKAMPLLLMSLSLVLILLLSVQNIKEVSSFREYY